MVPPSTPGTPTTANSGSNIIVSWTAPTTGSPITSYTVQIYCTNGEWSTTSSCDGSSSTVLANLSCTIPQTVLKAAPFSLTAGWPVYAVVEATNSYGTSNPSNYG
jgi:hypothetical protein